MTTSIKVTLDRQNNTIEVTKDGEQLEKLDVTKYVPVHCDRFKCSCKDALSSFFRGVIFKYNTAYGKRSQVTDNGDTVIISPQLY